MTGARKEKRRVENNFIKLFICVQFSESVKDIKTNLTVTPGVTIFKMIASGTDISLTEF